jgi:hypothetical protein
MAEQRPLTAEEKEWRKHPGVGEYDIAWGEEGEIARGGHAFGNERARPKPFDAKTPGPGQYEPAPPSTHHDPSYSFPRMNARPDEPQNQYRKTIPGVGAYNVSESAEASRPCAPAFKIGSATQRPPEQCEVYPTPHSPLNPARINRASSRAVRGRPLNLSRHRKSQVRNL